jgi:hypothetical protein
MVPTWLEETFAGRVVLYSQEIEHAGRQGAFVVTTSAAYFVRLTSEDLEVGLEVDFLGPLTGGNYREVTGGEHARLEYGHTFFGERPLVIPASDPAAVDGVRRVLREWAETTSPAR